MLHEKLAPAEEVGRWTTILEPFDSTMHEKHPVFRTDFTGHKVADEDAWSGQREKAKRRAKKDLPENEAMFPGLMSDAASHWGPEFAVHPSFYSSYHATVGSRTPLTDRDLCAAADCD